MQVYARPRRTTIARLTTPEYGCSPEIRSAPDAWRRNQTEGNELARTSLSEAIDGVIEIPFPFEFWNRIRITTS